MNNSVFFQYILDISQKEYPYCIDIGEFIGKNRSNRIEQSKIITYDDIITILENDDVKEDEKSQIRYYDKEMKSFINVSDDYYDELNEKSKRFKLLLVERVQGLFQQQEEVQWLKQITQELSKVNNKMEQMSLDVV